MRHLPVILLFVLLRFNSIAQHKIFDWHDSTYEVGSIHRLHNFIYYDAYQFYDSNTWKPYDTLVAFMKTHPVIKIELDVYLPPRGSPKHNMLLSKVYASMVTGYLIKKGLDSARIVPKGFGNTNPVPGCSGNDIAHMKTEEEKEAACQADRRMFAIILDVHYTKLHK